MKIFRLILVLSLVALVTKPVSSFQAQETSNNPSRLVSRSSFIFRGTVMSMNASAATAVVRVDEVLRNAGVVSDVQGKEVIVQLDRPDPMKEGEQAVFFTNVAIYGSRLTVREVSHTSSDEKLSSLQVDDVLKQVPDDDLGSRLAEAELVVLGKVSSVRSTELRGRRPPTSEHDPDWWQAAVRVESVEKGQATTQVITVLFPHSDDIRWFAAPKFKVGQEGVFLLRRNRDSKLKLVNFTALHPQDFQPLQALPRVKRLVLQLR
jgi:hypothetical protein